MFSSPETGYSTPLTLGGEGANNCITPKGYGECLQRAGAAGGKWAWRFLCTQQSTFK